MKIRNGQAYYDKTIGGWNLLTGDGIRDYYTTISFKESFTKIPNIMLALSGVDIINKHNSRIKVYVDNVTTHDFTICIHTWGDTEIYGAGVCWIAYSDEN
ncbi:H-type lectin domain-containing protein [Clostridium rectalis]|uniref:H-type lectin domain-containing protein n=1 Tax=Clostridium rectalis TaxID=2040295 RepID=UPI000F62D94A|nr:H-type lectin domain-containing protein [Clostridium rectalis]